jgi:hypothetical protein
VQFTGTNIGDLLNAKGITWGWFEGGFDLSIKNPNGTTGCARTTTSAVTGTTKVDYIQHHEPFQYYTQTANLKHLRPSSVKTIGETDAANHQYDINDFYAAVNAGNMPAVSFLKAPGYQDAHAGYSDPLDEQTFVTTVINFLQQHREWDSTAVIIKLRRLRRLVRPSTGSHCEPVDDRGRCAFWYRPVRHGHGFSASRAFRGGSRAGPVRVWTASALPGDLALRQGELRGSHPD